MALRSRYFVSLHYSFMHYSVEVVAAFLSIRFLKKSWYTFLF